MKGHASPVVFCLYVQSGLLNEKLWQPFVERRDFVVALLSRVSWVGPVISCLVSGGKEEEIVFRTICVVLEATPPQPSAEVTAGLASITAAIAAQVKLLDVANPFIPVLMERLLERGAQVTEAVHGVLSRAGPQFWSIGWDLYGCGDVDADMTVSWLQFVHRAVLSAESLTAEFLRMLLVDQRTSLLKALRSPHHSIVLQALVIIYTLALCRHEVICDALIAAGYVDVLATFLVTDKPNHSILHQYIFGILRNVLECAGVSAEERILEGGLATWIRTSLETVPSGSSADSYLKDLVVFINDASRAEKMERYRKTVPDWDEWSLPIVNEVIERRPDSANVQELLAKKKPAPGPGQVTGPVHCTVCKVPLTAYYMIEGSVYCSEHRPAQCASCRAPLGADFVQVGFLKYCQAHSPPRCVRCNKYVSRYFSLPEGIVCVDCGAPKCGGCKQPLLQGSCVSFKDQRYVSFFFPPGVF